MYFDKDSSLVFLVSTCLFLLFSHVDPSRGHAQGQDSQYFYDASLVFKFKTTLPEFYPSMFFLKKDTEPPPDCVGAIIHRKWAVTNTQLCFSEFDSGTYVLVPDTSYKVHVEYMGAVEAKWEVDHYTNRKRWNDFPIKNLLFPSHKYDKFRDIALAEIDRSDYGDLVARRQVAGIVTSNKIYGGHATMAVYASLSFPEPDSVKRLCVSTVWILPKEECPEIQATNGFTHICTCYMFTDALSLHLHMDSLNGPLYQGRDLLGIFYDYIQGDFHSKCVGNIRLIYLRLDSMVPWIEATANITVTPVSRKESGASLRGADLSFVTIIIFVLEFWY